MGTNGPRKAHWAILVCTSILCFAQPTKAQPNVPDAGAFPSANPTSNRLDVPPPNETESDCGWLEKDLPPFELIDLNPNSATYGSTYSLNTFQSEVLVIYWALAS